MMIISLLGYMGSGKTHISKLLARKLGCELIDLDKEISRRHNLSISEIFEIKGEIYFRQQERQLLEELYATKENCIISLGGGTPAYYNNMELINGNSTSFFLQTSVKTLSERLLPQKDKRPIIARLSNEDLPEFIAKHLFERNPFYSRALYTISTDNKDPAMIVSEILQKLDYYFSSSDSESSSIVKKASQSLSSHNGL